MQRVTRDSVTKQVIDSIIGYITYSQLSSGDKLPTEREFARMFDVGVPAVREAMSALSLMGIVKIIHGNGVFFANLRGAYMAPVFDIYYRLELVGDAESFSFWRILESAAALEAAKHITDAELLQLEENLASAKTALLNRDSERFKRLDQEFHGIICEASHNLLLSGAAYSIHVIQDHIRSIMSPIDSIREMFFRDHERIYYALKAHNPQEADSCMNQHITRIEEIYKKVKTGYEQFFRGMDDGV